MNVDRGSHFEMKWAYSGVSLASKSRVSSPLFWKIERENVREEVIANQASESWK